MVCGSVWLVGEAEGACWAGKIHFTHFSQVTSAILFFFSSVGNQEQRLGLSVVALSQDSEG